MKLKCSDCEYRTEVTEGMDRPNQEALLHLYETGHGGLFEE